MSALRFLRAGDVHSASLPLALPHAPSPRRDVSLGELDALMRTHRLTVACNGALYTARQQWGAYERYSVTARTMGEAVLAVVARIEAQS